MKTWEEKKNKSPIEGVYFLYLTLYLCSLFPIRPFNSGLTHKLQRLITHQYI